MSQINTKWSGRHTTSWLFGQDEVWITAGGKKSYIATMSPTHLLNTALYLERVAPEIAREVGAEGAPALWLQNTPLYKAIKFRLQVLAEEEGELAYKATPRRVYSPVSANFPYVYKHKYLNYVY